MHRMSWIGLPIARDGADAQQDKKGVAPASTKPGLRCQIYT